MTSDLVTQLTSIENFGLKNNYNNDYNNTPINFSTNTYILIFLAIILVIVIILIIFGILGFYYKFRFNLVRNTTGTYEFYHEQSADVEADNNKKVTGTRKKSSFGQPRLKNERNLEKKFKKSIEKSEKLGLSSIIPLSDKKIDPEISEKMPYLTSPFGWFPNTILKNIKYKYKKETPKKGDINDAPSNDVTSDGFKNVDLNSPPDKSISATPEITPEISNADQSDELTAPTNSKDDKQ